MKSKAASGSLPEPWKKQATGRFCRSFELKDHLHALQFLPVISAVVSVSYREISLQLHSNTLVVELPLPVNALGKADPYVIKLAKNLNMVAGERTQK